MAYQGFYGDIVHAEGAYNASKERNCFNKEGYSDMWWLRAYAGRRGNIYPTHGLGPISTALGINRGDRLEYLVSIESNDFTFGRKARDLAGSDSFFDEFAERSAPADGCIRCSRLELYRAALRVVGAQSVQLNRHSRFYRRRLGRQPEQHGHQSGKWWR